MACHIFTSYELSYVAALLNYKFCRGSGELHKEQGRPVNVLQQATVLSVKRSTATSALGVGTVQD